jgi:CO/xanthine dehydrogenase FAD-binding subunit
MSTLELVEPRSLKHALEVLRGPQPVVPLAGATDVYVLLNAGTSPGLRYLSLWNLDALRGITTRDGAVSIGALTTFSDIMRSPVVRKRLPMLAAAAREIGAVQIQNRGTIGGNVDRRPATASRCWPPSMQSWCSGALAACAAYRSTASTPATARR